MKRDWTEARAKVDTEGRCRVCRTPDTHRHIEAAHIVPRSRVTTGGEHPDNIIPLCSACHRAQHAGDLELLPFLTTPEQSYAAGLVGIAEAYRRTTNGRAA